MAFRGGVRGATIKLLDLEAALAFLRRRPDASAFILRWIKPPGSAFGGGNCCITFDVAFNFGGGRAFVVALVVAVVAANLDNAGGRAGGDGGTALPRAAAIAELLSITSLQVMHDMATGTRKRAELGFAGRRSEITVQSSLSTTSY